MNGVISALPNGSQHYQTSCSFEEVPRELIVEIFKNLSFEDLAKCSIVCKKWVEINSDPAVIKSYLPNFFFCKMLWNKYFGVVENEPPLPKNILELLGRYNNTHTLVLIPNKINDLPFDLKAFQTITKSRFSKDFTANFYCDGFLMNYSEGDYSIPFKKLIGESNLISRWVLFPKVEVVESSQIKPTCLEAVVCLIADRVLSGKWLCENKFFACEENLIYVAIHTSNGPEWEPKGLQICFQGTRIEKKCTASILRFNL